MSSSSSSSSSDTKSSGFGITVHHEGQTAENSIAPSPSGSSGTSDQQTDQKQKNQQGAIDEDDIKNNKP